MNAPHIVYAKKCPAQEDAMLRASQAFYAPTATASGDAPKAHMRRLAVAPYKGMRLLSALLLLVALFVAGMAAPKAQAQAAPANGFYLAAVGDDASYLIEPTMVTYTPDQTVQEALEAADLGFEFSGAFLDKVAGVGIVNGSYMYSFTNIEDRDEVTLGAVQASSIDALFISTTAAGQLGDGHVALTQAMAEYAIRTDGVKNYPDAKNAYAQCYDALPTADEGSAASLAIIMKEATASYDAVMAGTKYMVNFSVTKDSAKVTNATVTLTDQYGNVTQAMNMGNGRYRANVVALTYSYEVFDAAGLNGVRDEGLAVSGINNISAALPATEWFGNIRLTVQEESGVKNVLETCTASAGVNQRATQQVVYTVPDYVQSVANLYVVATPSAAVSSLATSYPLYVCYQGTDGAFRQSQVAYSSYSFAPEFLVEEGPKGTSFSYEIRHYVNTTSSAYQVQRCPCRIVRSPSLASLSVTDNNTQVLGSFIPRTKTYDVYTASDALTFSATPYGEEQYSLRINGSEAAPGQEVVVPITNAETQVPVTVIFDNAQLATYTVMVHKVADQEGIFTHDAGVSVEVINEAGGVLNPTASTATSDTYRLLQGRTYTYVGTKNEYFHVSNNITANSDVSIAVPTPAITDAATKLEINTTNQWYEGQPVFAKDEAKSTMHHTYYKLPDMWSSQSWLRITTVGDAPNDIIATYNRQDTGAKVTKEMTFQATNSPYYTADTKKVNLEGFTTTSGYSNTITVNVYTGQDTDGTLHYQDYLLTAERILTLPGISANDGNAQVYLMQTATAEEDTPVYGFERDVRDYTLQVIEGTEAVYVAYRFPTPMNAKSPYNGGYRVTLDGVTETYEAGRVVVQAVAVDPTLREQTFPLVVSHEDKACPDTIYQLRVQQMPRVPVSFSTNPQDATIVVSDPVTGALINPDTLGHYTLVSGKEYTYTVGAVGYAGVRNTFIASDSLELEVNLVQVQENPNIDAAITGEWPYFRADENNNGVVDIATPITADTTLLYWANQVGEGYDTGAVGCPILVDGYVYTYCRNQIVKMDTITGEVVAQNTMVGISSFAITPMTYADGMVFVGLSNGRVEAFSAKTLESLWVFKSPNGGQPNCPIAYHDGCIYTGFWNWSNNCDFVCLTVTDEDPLTPGSENGVIKDEKVPLWTFTHSGGFYWAGAWAGDNAVVVGSDNASISAGLDIEHEGNANGTLYSFDPKTGKQLDAISEYPNGIKIGNIRSSVTYTPEDSTLYWCGRGGYLCHVQLNSDGTFEKSTLKAIRLRNNSLDGDISSTSTPVVYNGRAYVGADHGSYNAFSGQSVNVVDLATDSVAYVINMQGRAQSSPIVSTAQEGETGYVYVYFFDNYSPGKLRVFKDRPGQTTPEDTVVEYDVDGTEYRDVAKTLFCPQGAQAQYCICSPIVDEYGIIYFKNDSANMMAVGPTITSIEVTQPPTQTVYGLGDTFNPEGMVITAHYSNGAERDISGYVSYSEEAFTEESLGTLALPLVFEHTMYYNSVNSDTSVGTADTEYNYPHPRTTVEIQVVSELAPTITTNEVPSGHALDSVISASYPYEMTFEASGTPHEFTWSLQGSLPNGLSFDAANASISGTPAAGTGGNYPITVTASNGVGSPASKSFVLEIEQRPTISTGANLGAAKVGTAVNKSLVATGTPAPITWVLGSSAADKMPPGLSLNAETGKITGTPTNPGEYSFRIAAVNAKGESSMPRTFTYKVNGVPQITTKTLGTAALGTTYARTLTATGYPVPTWSATGLPAGLALETDTGKITGTPTAEGTYEVTITASNSLGKDTKTYQLAVEGSSAAPQILTATLPAGIKGVPYEAALNISGSPSPTVMVTGLPTGLSFDAETGVITGTPAASGTFNIAVSAENAEGSAQATLQLVIQEPAAIIADGHETLEGFVVVGTAYNLAVSATGAPAPTITVDGLPAGLVYDPAASAIVGTPTEANEAGVPVTVTASNGAGADAVATYTLKVYEAPVFALDALPMALLGTAYSQNLNITGTPAPVVSVIGADSGLHYDAATGVLAGTPTAAGITTVRVTATNAAGTVSKTYAHMVADAPVITTTALADSSVGESYNAPVRATGFPAPQIEVTGLPEGLAYNSTYGAIVGTPTQGGTFDVQISATNDIGTDTKNLTLKVMQPFAITTTQLPAAMATTAYTAQIETDATSAVDFSWNAAAGSTLPAGLSLDAATGLISGTPEEQGTYQFVITAQAADGYVATKTLTLTVNPLTRAVELVSEYRAAPGLVGQAYTTNLAQQLVEVEGIPSAYTWAASSDSVLPAGLSLDAQTGVLAGTPTQPGACEFVVTCTNDIGTPATTAVSLVINQEPTISTTALDAGLVGQSYEFQLEGEGYFFSPATGEQGITWSWTATEDSQLPQGLELDSSTGLISGTPVARGTYEVAIIAANGAGLPATSTFTLVIDEEETAPSITTASLPSGVMGTAYGPAAIEALGYPAPTFAATGLPAGLSLDTTTGVISGTPTATGTFNVLITATNSQGSVTATLPIVIARQPQAPTIVTTSLPKATVGFAYEAALEASGYPTPTLAVTGLPFGMSFDAASGTISGTPQRDGNYQVHVSAANGVSPDASADLTLVVAKRDLADATVSGLEASYNYTGEDIEPQVTVTYGTGDDAVVLEQGVDYIIEYEDNIKPGTGKYFITGIGMYEGYASGTFVIVDAALDDVIIKAENLQYNARIQEPQVSVTVKGNVLEPGTDFTVEVFADEECTMPATPLEVGTYYAKASAAGAGNAVASFRIDHIDVRTLWPDLQNDNKWYMKETAVLEGTETMIMDYMAGTGLITGSKNVDGSVSFLPGKNITRGQLAVILCRAAGEPAPENPAANANFSDLKDGAYYVNAVNWAFENHVVNGSAGKFRPNDNVTRQEFAAMLANYAQHIEGIDIVDAGASVDLSKWTDGGKVSGWAQDSVKYLCAINAMGGSADLKPASNATRAEASKMVAVLMHDIVGLAAVPAE